MGKLFSAVAGYVAGGNDSGGAISGIDKVSVAADTKTTLSATLTTARKEGGGFANSTVAGYVAGGQDSGGRLSGIDKVRYPTNSTTT